MIVLTVSWVFAEYHNAGGWPTHGLSQSSSGWGHPNVWNPWNHLADHGVGAVDRRDAWWTFGRKPISDSEYPARDRPSSRTAALTTDAMP